MTVRDLSGNGIVLDVGAVPPGSSSGGGTAFDEVRDWRGAGDETLLDAMSGLTSNGLVQVLLPLTQAELDVIPVKSDTTIYFTKD